MSDIAIRVEGLSKSYRISHEGGPRYRTLRESLVDLARRPLRAGAGDSRETIWALRDVNLDVRQGEALGIIGRNGAGKSTLLKILSRITPPTSGRAEVYGRLGSLLEVGTGFHPELTGRENIYLNGAILGMRRREIQRHFDEIVAFAETEQFLDTPVKRYSTGMYMRLAFAVAAHLDTDILVVDEVLAVGDVEFQAKCLGKMQDVAGHGRTVLFVSHNTGAITQLCQRAVMLERGTLARDGIATEVVSGYLATHAERTRVVLGGDRRPAGSGGAWFEWVEVRDADDEPRRSFSIGDTVRIAFGLRLSDGRPRTKLVVEIRASDGLWVAHVDDLDSRFVLGNDHDAWDVTVDFDDIRLYPGTYYVTVWATDPAVTEEFDRVDDCTAFDIVDGGRYTSRLLQRHAGVVFLTPNWSSRRRAASSTESSCMPPDTGAAARTAARAVRQGEWRDPETPPGLAGGSRP